VSDLEGLLARLERRLGAMTEGPTALDGGITNRNFRVSFGGRPCVVRIPGKDTSLLGISREAERAANERAAELGLAPRVVMGDEECLVTEWISGELSDPVRLDIEQVARALRAFHDSGLRLSVRFWVPDLLDEYAEVVRARGGSLPPQYSSARELVRRIGDRLLVNDPVPCHNDLLPANMLITEGGVMLVDWEYAGMGHRMFDLGNLAVNCQLNDAAEARLLSAYFGRAASAQQRGDLHLMRLMSDAREGAWGVVQGVTSALDFDFEAYATRHFERLLAAQHA
jgi:thiamine kinase-like enzyme